jgi:hypothetical protein
MAGAAPLALMTGIRISRAASVMLVLKLTSRTRSRISLTLLPGNRGATMPEPAEGTCVTWRGSSTFTAVLSGITCSKKRLVLSGRLVTDHETGTRRLPAARAAWSTRSRLVVKVARAGAPVEVAVAVGVAVGVGVRVRVFEAVAVTVGVCVGSD